jgi:hypothetical protein
MAISIAIFNIVVVVQFISVIIEIVIEIELHFPSH